MSNLDLMRKRIQHNNKKQEEDFQKAKELRLAAKGVRQAASSTSSTSGRLTKVFSVRIQNFLGENGCLPEYEIDGVAYYKPTANFLSLLERYDIQKVMKNYL